MVGFLPIIRAFNQAQVSYVIVGGVAVVLHGHGRLTMDIDFVIRLDDLNVNAAARALADLGFQPRVPVDPLGLANEQTRRQWIDEKNMRVFSFVSHVPPFLIVDLFVDYPLDFRLLMSHSVTTDLA